MGTDADHIIGLYDRHAGPWVAARLRQARFVEQAWLDKFCGIVGAGGAVLDLGCGAGEPMASHLVRQGHAVTGVDSSTAMIQLFKQRLPRQQAIVADMRALSLKRAFQGILAWDSFFHLSPDSQRGMFAIFRDHAAPGAALMFTSGSAQGEAIGELEGEPLYHASVDIAEYNELLDSHGFDVASMVQQDRSCGDRTIWLARRR
jgi:cyclopropane fatty-acyl-phospholipid synthase-like methyltransferase